MLVIVFDTSENIVETGGNADFSFSYVFIKVSLSVSLKSGIVGERVICIHVADECLMEHSLHLSQYFPLVSCMKNTDACYL